MPTSTLIVLFVAAVLLHNAEEATSLPQWSRHAGRWHPGVGDAEFRFAAVVLSGALVVSAILATHAGPGSRAAYVFFGYVFAMVVNAVVPHLAATIARRAYMPGTATGLLLNLPLGSALLYRGVSEGWVAIDRFAWVAPAVSLTLLASIPVLFAIGRRLFDSATSSP